ncbi:MAG: SO_0444 family Cu/Zn efflux transporter [Phycisphaerae bacterium]|nr:SO_0444 family Cu/Zn efflux transporter [Phycisphaerae bacterium]
MDSLRDIFLDIVKLWNEMAIFLLFGFTVAGILSRLMSTATVASHMGGASWWSITKAALLGIPLPLCSCGVIPTGVWLRDHGAGRGATSAFLISTPQTGIDSLAITYSFLGLVFALFRPIAALFSGLFGGILVNNLTSEKKESSASVGSDSCHCPAHQPCAEAQKLSLKTHIVEALRYGLITIPKEIGLWLFVGVAAAGLIAWLIPERYFEQHFQSNLLSMLLMIALGIPLYICSSASVPVAVVLAMRGLSPGAVFVFLMAGPATNIGAIAILFKVLGVRATIIQTVSVMISALLCGLALDWIYNLIYAGQGLDHFRQIAQSTMAEHVHSAFGFFRVACSILLLLIVLNALRIQWLDKRNKRLTSCHQN